MYPVTSAATEISCAAGDWGCGGFRSTCHGCPADGGGEQYDAMFTENNPGLTDAATSDPMTCVEGQDQPSPCHRPDPCDSYDVNDNFPQGYVRVQELLEANRIKQSTNFIAKIATLKQVNEKMKNDCPSTGV